MYQSISIRSVFCLGVILGCCVVTETAAVELELKKGVSVSAEDARNTFTLNGRLQIDYLNRQDEQRQLANDAEVKRLWLTMSARVDDWFFLSRVDLDGGESRARLASFIEYRGLNDLIWLSFGRHKEPFGMSWVGSIKHVGTPERSAISDRYTFARSVGFMARGHGQKLGYQLGIFEDGDVTAVSDGQEAKHLAVTGRVFSRLLNTPDRLVHVGVGVSSRHAENAYGLELAYRHQRLHIQSEWMSSKENYTAEKERYSGVYIESGWFFTQDTMNYKGGVFSAVKPSSPTGAWQCVARVDYGDGDYSDIGFGERKGKAVALGLNWFANANLRFALSVTRGEVDAPAFSDTSRGEELRLRGQFTF